MSETAKSGIKVGDEVRVYDGWRARQDRTAIPGEVVKVGRTLVRIKYRSQEDAFRMDTGVINDGYGGTAFETLVQAAREERRIAAMAVLKAHHVELKMGHDRSFTLEQVEALAEVVKTWEA